MKSGKPASSDKNSPTNRDGASGVVAWTVRTFFGEEVEYCRDVSKDDINVRSLVTFRWPIGQT